MHQLIYNLRFFRCWLWGHQFPDREDYSRCFHCDVPWVFVVDGIYRKGKHGPGPQLKYKLTGLLLWTAIKSHTLMEWLIWKT